MPASDAGGGTGKSLTWSNLTREEEKPQHEREDCAHPEDSDVSDRPPAIASENSRQPRVRGGEKSVTSAAHVAAITTTRARRRNRRLVIPVAPGVHLGGLPGGLWRVPLGIHLMRFVWRFPPVHSNGKSGIGGTGICAQQPNRQRVGASEVIGNHAEIMPCLDGS